MKATPTIGIIGGGQLGRMLTLAALPLGFRVVVLDPGPECPAKQVGAEQIVGDLYDEKALNQLADRADYLTIEIEHMDAAALRRIAELGKPVNPAPATVELIQDKYQQKVFLQAASVPVAPFVAITDLSSAKRALEDFGGSMIIKTRHGAYDGRGNYVVRSTGDIAKAFKLFEGRGLYAEAIVPFTKELAAMAARNMAGEVAVYPIVETIHARNICLEVRAPAAIDQTLIKRAAKVVKKTASLLNGAGLFGIELFLTADGQILVNEIAPRVHNSGHYTMDACLTSQFEQHIRAIAGLPLGATDMVAPAAVMINILGERNGPTELTGVGKLLAIPHTSLHLYGKSPTKVDRKMGHITATGDSLQQAGSRARKARKALTI